MSEGYDRVLSQNDIFVVLLEKLVFAKISLISRLRYRKLVNCVLVDRLWTLLVGKAIKIYERWFTSSSVECNFC